MVLSISCHFSLLLIPSVSLPYRRASAVPHPCSPTCIITGKFNAHYLITFLSTGKE